MFQKESFRKNIKTDHTIDDKIRNGKLQYSITILTEKQDKYQHYHLEKLININILQVQKYYPRIKEAKKLIVIGKALEKQRKKIEDQGIKQVEA